MLQEPIESIVGDLNKELQNVHEPVSRKALSQSMADLESELIEGLKSARIFSASGNDSITVGRGTSMSAAQRRLRKRIQKTMKSVDAKISHFGDSNSDAITNLPELLQDISPLLQEMLKELKNSFHGLKGKPTEHTHAMVKNSLVNFAAAVFAGKMKATIEEPLAESDDGTESLNEDVVLQSEKEAFENELAALSEDQMQFAKASEVDVKHLDVEAFTEVIRSHWYDIVTTNLSAFLQDDGKRMFSFEKKRAILVLMRVMEASFFEVTSERNIQDIRNTHTYEEVFNQGTKEVLGDLDMTTEGKLSWDVIKSQGGELVVGMYKSFRNYLHSEVETFYGDYQRQGQATPSEEELVALMESSRLAYLDLGQEYPWGAEEETLLENFGEDVTPEERAKHLNYTYHLGMEVRNAETVLAHSEELREMRKELEEELLEAEEAVSEEPEVKKTSTRVSINDVSEEDADRVRISVMKDFFQDVYQELLQKRQRLDRPEDFEDMMSLIFAVLNATQSGVEEETDEFGLGTSWTSQENLEKLDGLLRSKKAELVDLFDELSKYAPLVTEEDPDIDPEEVRDFLINDQGLLKYTATLHQFENSLGMLIAIEKFKPRFNEFSKEIMQFNRELTSYPGVLTNTLRRRDPFQIFSTEQAEAVEMTEEKYAVLSEQFERFQKVLLRAAKVLHKFDEVVGTLQEMIRADDPEDTLELLQLYTMTYKVIEEELTQPEVEAPAVENVQEEAAHIAPEIPEVAPIESSSKMLSPEKEKHIVEVPKEDIATEEQIRRLQKHLREGGVPRKVVDTVETKSAPYQAANSASHRDTITMRVQGSQMIISEEHRQIFREAFGMTKLKHLGEEAFQMETVQGVLSINKLQYFFLVVMEVRVEGAPGHLHYGATDRQLAAIFKYFFGDLVPMDYTKQIANSFAELVEEHTHPTNSVPRMTYEFAETPMMSWMKGEYRTRFYRPTEFWKMNKKVAQAPYIAQEIREVIRWFMTNEQQLRNRSYN